MANNNRLIRVLSVDDSMLMRRMLTNVVDEQSDMTMVATAPDPLAARELIKQYDPDVLTLDVEMPHMHGLEFLKRLMRLRPMPVIMVSSLTERGSDITVQALEAGAVECIAKPDASAGNDLDAVAADMVDKIRAASRADVSNRKSTAGASQNVSGSGINPRTIFAVGASTGGVDALNDLLKPLPPETPPTVIVQHMPGGFTGSFARRLDGLCQMTVREAVDGQSIERGCAYLAPGGSAHLRLERRGDKHIMRLQEGDRVNRHRPSVDVMFESVAESVGANAVGMLLTGMGRDGADGLLKMRQAGAKTLVQDEESSIVFGMPRAAVDCGAADEQISLPKMAERAIELARRSSK